MPTSTQPRSNTGFFAGGGAGGGHTPGQLCLHDAEAGVLLTGDHLLPRIWSRGWDALPGGLRRMALAEILAHLHHLAAAGHLTPVPGRPHLRQSAG